MVLLKAVLASMPAYTMSCFKLPVSICNKIQSILTRFWWDSNSGDRKMCWVAWDKLTRGKQEGGLGFRDVQNFNDALLAKLSWRLLTQPDSLLGRILKGKYYHSTSFLECTSAENSSHGWQGILIGRDLLKLNLGKAIGNGRSTRVWEDNWVSTSKKVKPIGPAEQDIYDMKVADLFLPNSTDWDRVKIREVVPELEREIMCIKPSQLEAEDKFIWLPQASGEYSTKSGYHTIYAESHQPLQSENTNQEFNWHIEIWKGKYSEKIKLFLWKIVQGALPVGETLLRRKIVPHSRCQRCGEPETTLHMLFHCQFAKSVWTLAPFRETVEPSAMLNIKTSFQALRSFTCLPPTEVVAGPLYPWILWNLWTARNNLIFNNRHFTAEEVMINSIIGGREWQEAQPVQRGISSNQRRTWKIADQQEAIRCFTDGSWKAETLSAGLGWRFISPQKRTMAEASKAMDYVGSALAAEALAIRLAVEHACTLGITKLQIVSDSSQVIRAITTGSYPSEIHGVLHDIDKLSSQFIEVSFNFIPREANLLADTLAKSAHRALSVIEVANNQNP